MPWKCNLIYPRAYITILLPIAIAEKIAMQFMAMASPHHDCTTRTPLSLHQHLLLRPLQSLMTTMTKKLSWSQLLRALAVVVREVIWYLIVVPIWILIKVVISSARWMSNENIPRSKMMQPHSPQMQLAHLPVYLLHLWDLWGRRCLWHQAHDQNNHLNPEPGPLQNYPLKLALPSPFTICKACSIASLTFSRSQLKTLHWQNWMTPFSACKIPMIVSPSMRRPPWSISSWWSLPSPMHIWHWLMMHSGWIGCAQCELR